MWKTRVFETKAAKEAVKMTNITVFGQNEQDMSKKKVIKFVYYISDHGPCDGGRSPSIYDNVCLLGKSSFSEMDLMIAWYNGDPAKYLYLGQWNDGVI